MTTISQIDDLMLAWGCLSLFQVSKTFSEEMIELLESGAVIHLDTLTTHTAETFAEKFHRLLHVEFELGLGPLWPILVLERVSRVGGILDDDSPQKVLRLSFLLHLY